MNYAFSDDLASGKLSRRGFSGLFAALTHPSQLSSLLNLWDNCIPGILVCWWYMFGLVAATIGSAAYSKLLRYGPRTAAFGALPLALVCFRHFAVSYSFLAHYDMPFRCLGSFKRSTMEVLALSAALVLREFFEFSTCSLMALVGTTADLHVVAQSLHIAYDVSIRDVMLGSLMQIVIYLLGENVYVVIIVFTFCGGVTVYRYASYSPPIMPEDVEEELDEHLC